jgi:hypothetical protein
MPLIKSTSKKAFSRNVEAEMHAGKFGRIRSAASSSGSNPNEHNMDSKLDVIKPRDPHQLINQSSGLVEYYTPAEIVAAARATMGGIDLDPASSPEANLRIGASRFFTIKDNSLDQPWLGRVWMNHPFGRSEKACRPGCAKTSCAKRGYHLQNDKPGNAEWINKLVSEYESGRVEQACCITFACTSEAWFRPLLCLPQCFLYGRTNYCLPGGGVLRGVTKGSCITYFGQDVGRFAACFRHLGEIKTSVFPAEGPQINISGYGVKETLSGVLVRSPLGVSARSWSPKHSEDGDAVITPRVKGRNA